LKSPACSCFSITFSGRIVNIDWPHDYDVDLPHGVSPDGFWENHVTQVINQRFHHMRGKMRVPLNKKIEPLPVDLSQ